MVEPPQPPEIPAETELAQTPSVADPVASPPGPVFAVQIGAYDSRNAAEAAWAALSANRPILVEDFRFDIRPARVKGKTWLRGLVRDFATRQDAAAFCSALAGTEYGCILRTIAD